MEEPEVRKVVEEWVKSEHPDWIIWSEWHFDIISGPAKHLPSLAIECKGRAGKRSSFQRAVGQCLDYMIFNKGATYIAVPDDYVYKDFLSRVLKGHNLPIGILTVSGEHEVKILRQAPRRNTV